MHDEINRLEAEIAKLRTSIEGLAGMPDAQRQLQSMLEARERELADLRRATRGPEMNAEISAERDVNIATNQTINNFFGGQPTESGARLLADYLDSLVEECQRLRLARLTDRRQTGSEGRTAPSLRLQDVYTSLTTDGPKRTVHQRIRSAARLHKLIPRLKLETRSHEVCPPEQVRELEIGGPKQVIGYQPGRPLLVADALSAGRSIDDLLSEFDPAAELGLYLVRPELAVEAIAGQRRLVLLGEPGYGKSTVLRYLALLLALRHSDPTVHIPGWAQKAVPAPIYCPLGSVAAILARSGDSSPQAADQALWQALGEVLDSPQGIRAGLREFLRPALRHGGVLLLFDGLDELPVTASDGSSPRARVAGAIQRLAGVCAAHIVVTSRIKPYQQPGDWHMPADEGWVTRTIQPLAFGQVRLFVDRWYRALAEIDPDLSTDQAEARIAALTAALETNARVRPLVASPLLLTMLAILHYNRDELPRDQVRLYDECVQLLLERWEPERTPGVRHDGLLERLGNLPGLDLPQLRRVLHELAFQAHSQPAEDDGRGAIDAYLLKGRMLSFFEKIAPQHDAAAKVRSFCEVLNDESGLLLDRGGSYAFPHLTFQEFLAACYLADQTDMIKLAYAQWSGPDSGRWHVPLLLMAGRLRQQGPKSVERDGLLWLQHLCASGTSTGEKSPTQRRRDAVLAAQSFVELDVQHILEGSALDLKRVVLAPLREAIVAMLAEPEPQISPVDRIAAARVLGALGDPRYPTTAESWRAELARRNERFGQPDGSFCYVKPGTYQIGGWDEGDEAANLTLPAFWVAKLSVTVAQYAPFVAAGYGPDAERWWTPEGWKWKLVRSRTQPAEWSCPQYTQPNQPVIGVTWYEAVAYCAWLSERLADALPPGYVVRLPTEAEWEVAAAFDGVGRRRPYPWGEAEPSTALAVFNELKLDMAAPVGCCPAGVAACGALDLARNVWEWTQSALDAYPAGAGDGAPDFTPDEWNVPLRGGDWYSDSSNVRCGARNGGYPFSVNYDLGFRVVLAPSLAR